MAALGPPDGSGRRFAAVQGRLDASWDGSAGGWRVARCHSFWDERDECWDEEVVCQGPVFRTKEAALAAVAKITA